MKTKKLKQFKQIDGKLDEPVAPAPTQKQYKTLDQICGQTGMDRYKTFDEEEYKESLANMNLSDLQTHATRHSLVPLSDRGRLTNRLLQEFRRHVNLYTPTEKPRQIKATPEALKILAGGR